LLKQFLDQCEAQLVFEVGFPELLVVVDFVPELREDQLLSYGPFTPVKPVLKVSS
jgi:hypothetical protein